VGLDESFAAGSPTSVVFAVRPAASHHAKEQTAVAPVHSILSRAETSNMLTHQYRKSLEKVTYLLKHFDSWPRMVSPILPSSIEKKLLSLQQFASLKVRFQATAGSNLGCAGPIPKARMAANMQSCWMQQLLLRP
jgi:hypothetical protein